ncbi:hypothetical protein ERJ75_001634200 [Trypanosoma vivax]|nr:hypothetical protein ERJ75_001634200 [Trypanosoma vivax]
MGLASDGNAGPSGNRGREVGNRGRKGKEDRKTGREEEKMDIHKEHADRSYLRPQQAHGEIGHGRDRDNISYSEVAADVEKHELRDVTAQKRQKRKVRHGHLSLCGKGTEDKLCTGVAVTETTEGVRARRAIMEIRSLYPTVFWETAQAGGMAEATRAARQGENETQKTENEQHRGLHAKKQSGSAERAPDEKRRGTWVKGITGGEEVKEDFVGATREAHKFCKRPARE